MTAKNQPNPVAVSTPATTVRVFTNADGATYTQSGGSKSWRDNNPGNLVYGGTARAYGAIGEDLTHPQKSQSALAIFPNAQAGQDALHAYITKHGSSTVGAFMAHYAPAGNDKKHPINNTKSYTKFVENKVGVSGGTLISSLKESQIQALEGAIEQFEQWHQAGQISGNYEVPGMNITQAAGYAYAYDAAWVSSEQSSGPQLFFTGAGVSIAKGPTLQGLPTGDVKIANDIPMPVPDGGITATFDYEPLKGGGYSDSYSGQNTAGVAYNWTAQVTANGAYTLHAKTSTAHGQHNTELVSATRKDPYEKTTGRTSGGTVYETSRKTGANGTRTQLNWAQTAHGALASLDSAYTPTANGSYYSTAVRTGTSKGAYVTYDNSGTGTGAYHGATTTRTGHGGGHSILHQTTQSGGKTSENRHYTANGNSSAVGMTLKGGTYSHARTGTADDRGGYGIVNRTDSYLYQKTTFSGLGSGRTVKSTHKTTYDGDMFSKTMAILSATEQRDSNATKTSLTSHTTVKTVTKNSFTLGRSYSYSSASGDHGKSVSHATPDGVYSLTYSKVTAGGSSSGTGHKTAKGAQSTTSRHSTVGGAYTNSTLVSTPSGTDTTTLTRKTEGGITSSTHGHRDATSAGGYQNTHSSVTSGGFAHATTLHVTGNGLTVQKSSATTTSGGNFNKTLVKQTVSGYNQIDSSHRTADATGGLTRTVTSGQAYQSHVYSSTVGGAFYNKTAHGTPDKGYMHSTSRTRGGPTVTDTNLNTGTSFMDIQITGGGAYSRTTGAGGIIHYFARTPGGQTSHRTSG